MKKKEMSKKEFIKNLSNLYEKNREIVDKFFEKRIDKTIDECHESFVKNTSNYNRCYNRLRKVNNDVISRIRDYDFKDEEYQYYELLAKKVLMKFEAFRQFGKDNFYWC